MRKKGLETKFAKAAHDLMEFNNSAAMVLPIPNTTPQQFIAIGSATEICGLLLPQKPAATAVQGAMTGEVITIGAEPYAS